MAECIFGGKGSYEKYSLVERRDFESQRIQTAGSF